MNLLYITIVLLLMATGCVILLARDVAESRLRQRIASVRTAGAATPVPTAPRMLAIRSTGERGRRTDRIMRLLRLNPDISQQNLIPWRVVLAIAGAVGLAGFFYGRPLLGWQLALALSPIEAFLVARFIFGWERARYQNALLEQIPEVMAMLCRAIGIGIPLTEALRSVAQEVPSPSREEFMLVISDVAIGQSLERSLWRLQERAGLAEYAFFAITIALQVQTGGNLVETLQNLQDIVRKRVGVSKRGKALAAEARISAQILSSLPFFMSAVLYLVQPGFLDFFLHTQTGNHLALIAAGMLAVGNFIMRQTIQSSVAP
jgi:tight adherence protein B